MKKTLAALLAASMALSLCACGGGSKPAETTAAAVESGATETAGAADVSYRITCNNGNQRTLINP